MDVSFCEEMNWMEIWPLYLGTEVTQSHITFIGQSTVIGTVFFSYYLIGMEV